MSLQVQSSQQPTSGRRTPQIYQNLPSTPSAGTPPTNGNSSAKSSSSKLSLKSGKQSPVVEVTATATAEPTTTAKDVPKTPNVMVAVTKLEKTPTSSSPKTTEKAKDEKDKTATNGSSNGTHGEKETNGKHEETAKAAGSETPKKEPVEKVVKDSPRASPRSTPQKQQPESIPVEQAKTPESAGKKTKESPAVAPALGKVDVTPKAPEKTAAEGDEMESLVVEPSEYEDSPMPPRTGGKTKLLKYSGAPPTRARISPFRVKETTANASTIVNLSTVSEGQDCASKDSSLDADSQQLPSLGVRPLRAISGRRGMRPITDIQFTYRKSTEMNDSASSLNVTVGSEIHNDSLRTPAPGSSRKRKAMTPESTSDALDVKEIVESPKRTRLDFSGFLGIVASPVTMLKNRLSRVRLQSSTPVAKRSFDEEDLTKCVQAEATTTTANISGEGAAKMDVDPAADATTTDDKIEDVEKAKADADAEEQTTDLPSEEEAAKKVDGSEDAAESPVEVKDVTNKRQFCVVM